MSRVFSTSSAAALNRYLAGVEQRAFRMARYAVSDADEAMDIVQDAMLTLARKYATKPEAEWPPLFFRILRKPDHRFSSAQNHSTRHFRDLHARRSRRRYEPDRSRQRWSRGGTGVPDAARCNDTTSRRCGCGVAHPAARSLPAARVGRARCGGDRARYEMLRRQCEDALLARGAHAARTIGG